MAGTGLVCGSSALDSMKALGITAVGQNLAFMPNPENDMTVKIAADGNPSYVPFATVASTGSYNDLLNQPNIPQGTVTSLGAAVPAGMTVTGSPITTSGNFTFAWDSSTAKNLVLASPTSISGAPTFRSLSATDIPSLPNSKIMGLGTVAISNLYSDLDGKPTLNSGTVTSVGLGVPTFLSVTGSPVTTSGSFTIESASGLTKNQFIGSPDGSNGTLGMRSIVQADLPTRTQSVVARTFNSAFQPNATRDTLCIYSVSISASISLLGGQTGTVSFQTSPTSGGTYTEQSQIANGNTGTLTIGLNLTNVNVFNVMAFVPANYYVKLVTSGTATIAYTKGQENTL